MGCGASETKFLGSLIIHIVGYIYIYMLTPHPPLHNLPSVGLGSGGKTRSATETVTSRKSPTALLYCTICDVVSSSVLSCILRSVFSNVHVIGASELEVQDQGLSDVDGPE